MEEEDIGQMIEDCKKREAKLSSWEHDFIVSIETQFETRGSLSKRQLEILEEIWDKVT